MKAVGADADGLYPMRLVARLTGLNADTIRAWERRYEAVTPDRSAGNTRRFSADDVRRLTLLRDAVGRGHAISVVAALTTEKLAALVDGAQAPSDDAEVLPDASFEKWRETYLGLIEKFEVRRAFEMLGRSATLLDRKTFVFEVVLPMLHEVGKRWAAGSLGVGQEHLVSRQLTAVVEVMLESRITQPGAPKLLMSTPPGHRHEFGVLVAALLAVTRGIEPTYLGPDLPLEELSWAVRMSRASALVLSVARDLSPAEAESLPKQLELIASWTPLWIGCPEDHELVEGVPSARFFHRFEDFDLALDEL